MSKTEIKGLKENLDKLQTGDILLFSGAEFWFSKLIRYWTKSQFTHVGLVLRNPTYISPELTGLYMWESGIESFPDSENHVKKLGVQITSIDELLESEPDVKFIVHRTLNTTLSSKEIAEKITLIHQTVHNKPYDTNIYDFLMASADVKYIEKKIKLSSWFLVNWLRPSHKRNDTYFCSAFVGFVYTQLGLLPPETKWTECTPEFFSSDNITKMPIVGSNYLGVNKLLYQNPKRT
jgi:hypothetical protein